LQNVGSEAANKFALTLEHAGIRHAPRVAVELAEWSAFEIVDMLCDDSQATKTQAEALRVFVAEAEPRLFAAAAAKVAQSAVTISALSVVDLGLGLVEQPATGLPTEEGWAICDMVSLMSTVASYRL
jgi:hypothetical protein